MYSMVLMAALTTAPETPQFNGFFRDLFNGSCHGRDRERESDRAASGSCHGSCHGIFGGRIRNFFGGLGCRGSCNGCGGCNGNLARGRDRDYDRDFDRPYDRGVAAGGTGCTGGRYMYASGSCLGGGGCYGSSFGSSCFGYAPGANVGLPPISVPSMPTDGFGGGFAQPVPANYGMMQPTSNNCCDSCGTPMFASGPMLGTPMMAGDSMPTDYPTIRPQNLPSGVPQQMPGGTPNIDVERRSNSVVRKESLTQPTDATRGTVLVRVPKDATLSVEGRPLTVTNGERSFVTPPLPTDRDAIYTFKMEYTRDGETTAVSKKVKVRAGGTATVEFADLMASGRTTGEPGLPQLPTVPAPQLDESVTRPAVPAPATSGSGVQFNARTTTKSPTQLDIPTVKPPVAPDQAKITVKLPAGATLFVNGAKNERTELTRVFNTPTLAAGKTYEYTMKSETTRNGLPEYQEQKVEFRAGDVLTVDFTTPPLQVGRADGSRERGEPRR